MVVIAIAGLLFAGMVYGHHKIRLWSEQLVVLPQPQVIEFPPGTRLRELSQQLSKEGIIRHPRVFELWVRAFADYSKFQAGTYRFENEVSPLDVVRTISQGKNYETFALELTIPEGFTYQQISDKLMTKGVGTKEEYDSLLRDSDFIASLSIPSATLEGFLYPATYRFQKTPTAREVIARAAKTFWEKLPSDYEKSVGYLGLGLQEAVTFASLIEVETPIDDERPLIAEVIWNRLKGKIPIAIDAAVIYGIEDYQGDITKKHLSDPTNPYNTRIRLGLPPTPICSPAEASLRAILTPSREGYLYYVLDPGTDRRHHFSKTGEEHEIYVRKLVNAK
jgi:UPF0755 protein